MVTSADKNVILLPIFPEYAKAIFEGRKGVEFRKLNIPRKTSHVVVYSTAPDKALIGIFEVDKITISSPINLWKKFKDVGCVKKKFLMKYYSGHERGVALHVGKRLMFNQPVPLECLEDNLTPPQSFRYLKTDHINRIQKYIA